MLNDFLETFRKRDDEPELSVELKSGPGAPIFEQDGPHTRIRRTPVRAIATATWAGGPREFFGRVNNVSPGGCLLTTETTIEIGTMLTMSIIVIGDDQRAKVDVTGVVRRVTDHDGRQSYGIEFLTIDSRDKESVQWLYAQAMR